MKHKDCPENCHASVAVLMQIRELLTSWAMMILGQNGFSSLFLKTWVSPKAFKVTGLVPWWHPLNRHKFVVVKFWAVLNIRDGKQTHAICHPPTPFCHSNWRGCGNNFKAQRMKNLIHEKRSLTQEWKPPIDPWTIKWETGYPTKWTNTSSFISNIEGWFVLESIEFGSFVIR